VTALSCVSSSMQCWANEANQTAEVSSVEMWRLSYWCDPVIICICPSDANTSQPDRLGAAVVDSEEENPAHGASTSDARAYELSNEMKAGASLSHIGPLINPLSCEIIPIP
jgi:hypothetical protein